MPFFSESYCAPSECQRRPVRDRFWQSAGHEKLDTRNVTGNIAAALGTRVPSFPFTWYLDRGLQMRIIPVVAAVAGLVTALDLVEIGRMVPLRVEAIAAGDTNHPGCTNCNLLTFTFGECDHTDGTMKCFTTQCIFNYFAMWNCATKSGSGAGNCNTTNDASFVYRRQTVRTGTFTCTSPGGFTPVPNFPPPGTCSGSNGCSGRCYTTCSGGSVILDFFFYGGNRCS